MLPLLGIGWSISTESGWGVFGTNLAIELVVRGSPHPLLLAPPGRLRLPSPLHRQLLEPLFEQTHEIARHLASAAGKTLVLSEATVIHPLDRLHWSDLSETVQGRVNVGFVFFEDTDIDRAAKERAQKFDRILCGSTWNRDVLQDRGLPHARVALQGVDEAVFQPGPRLKLFGDRFVVFSGGKLEHRKGQDIVLAAFRAFRDRHPQALLVTAWQNHWKETADSIVIGAHAETAPEVDAKGDLDIVGWAVRHGIPADAVVDLGWIGNNSLHHVLREAHAAIFPNRCEGGTNLMAMECMASGVPTVLSANTGHLDLIRDGNCYALIDQRPIAATFGVGTEGWGESSVEELVATLEWIHDDAPEAARRRGAGVTFMKTMVWRHQVAQLVEEIDDLG